MSATADPSNLGRIAAALEGGAPADEVLDLVDETIERASAEGDGSTILALAELLDRETANRPAARGLLVASARARAAAGSLGEAQPFAESHAAEPATAAPRFSGWWRRVGAFVLDWLVLFAVVAATPGESDAAVGLALVLLPIAYFAGLHAYGHGRTIGKWAFGIAVRATDGSEVALPRALGRAAVQCVLWLTVIGGLVDSLLPLGDARRRSLHDHAAGTLVVRTR